MPSQPTDTHTLPPIHSQGLFSTESRRRRLPDPQTVRPSPSDRIDLQPTPPLVEPGIGPRIPTPIILQQPYIRIEITAQITPTGLPRPLPFRFRLSGPHNRPDQGREGGVDVDALFGGGLEEESATHVGVLECRSGRDLALVWWEVGFVTLMDVLRSREWLSDA